MTKLLRRSDLMRATGLKRSALDQLRRTEPTFPQPVYHNRTPMWSSDEIDAWLTRKLASRPLRLPAVLAPLARGLARLWASRGRTAAPGNRRVIRRVVAKR